MNSVADSIKRLAISQDGHPHPQVVLRSNNKEGMKTAFTKVMSTAREDFSAKYDIIREIGKGGFSTVYQCRDRPTKKDYAVKVVDLRPLKLRERFNPARLRREVEIMKRLEHPNIIQFVSVYEDDDNLMMVMEYCPGHELFDVILARHFFTEADAKPIFAQIARALYYLHSLNILHRDVKPENVLVSNNRDPNTGEMVVKLLDFGLSKNAGNGSVAKTFVGTPCYVAPEVEYTSKGIGGTYSFPADCWSLGAVLYVMLIAKFPEFEQDPHTGKIVVKLAPHQWDHISSEAKDLIRGLMNTNPAARLTMGSALMHPWLGSKYRVTQEQLSQLAVSSYDLSFNLQVEEARLVAADRESKRRSKPITTTGTYTTSSISNSKDNDRNDSIPVVISPSAPPTLVLLPPPLSVQGTTGSSGYDGSSNSNSNTDNRYLYAHDVEEGDDLDNTVIMSVPDEEEVGERGDDAGVNEVVEKDEMRTNIQTTYGNSSSGDREYEEGEKQLTANGTVINNHQTMVVLRRGGGGNNNNNHQQQLSSNGNNNVSSGNSSNNNSGSSNNNNNNTSSSTSTALSIGGGAVNGAFEEQIQLAPLLHLQRSIAICFDEVHASYKDFPEVASEVRQGATLCREQLTESTKMLRKVEQTASAVLNMFPDLELAVEEGEPELAAEFFELIKGWVAELREMVAATQSINKASMFQIQQIVMRSTAGIQQHYHQQQQQQQQQRQLQQARSTSITVPKKLLAVVLHKLGVEEKYLVDHGVAVINDNNNNNNNNNNYHNSSSGGNNNNINSTLSSSASSSTTTVDNDSSVSIDANQIMNMFSALFTSSSAGNNNNNNMSGASAGGGGGGIAMNATAVKRNIISGKAISNSSCAATTTTTTTTAAVLSDRIYSIDSDTNIIEPFTDDSSRLSSENSNSSTSSDDSSSSGSNDIRMKLMKHTTGNSNSTSSSISSDRRVVQFAHHDNDDTSNNNNNDSRMRLEENIIENRLDSRDSTISVDFTTNTHKNATTATTVVERNNARQSLLQADRIDDTSCYGDDVDDEDNNSDDNERRMHQETTTTTAAATSPRRPGAAHLAKALQKLRQVDVILEQLSVFWANTEVVLDLLTKKGQHVKNFVGFAAKPRLMARFTERMEEYKRFWEGVSIMCSNYIAGVQSTNDKQRMYGFLEKDLLLTSHASSSNSNNSAVHTPVGSAVKGNSSNNNNNNNTIEDLYHSTPPAVPAQKMVHSSPIPTPPTVTLLSTPPNYRQQQHQQQQQQQQQQPSSNSKQ